MDLIEVKHAIKTYQTGEDSFNALNDVSLNVKKGEFVAIMGTSGSGKSTFMNMLGTLDKPNSGSYYLDGEDMLHLDSDRLAMVRCEKMGFVFDGQEKVIDLGEAVKEKRMIYIRNSNS